MTLRRRRTKDSLSIKATNWLKIISPKCDQNVPSVNDWDSTTYTREQKQFNLFSFTIEVNTDSSQELTNVRVEKMLEKPGTKKGDRSFGKATLGSPWMWLHHSHLLEGSLLPHGLIDDFEPWSFACCGTYCNSIFLSHGFPCVLKLTHHPIFQTLEMPRHRFQGKRRVYYCSPIPCHCFKWRYHCLHLIAVVSVSSVNLEEHTHKK